MIGQTVVSFTDYLGDRRFILNFFGVESFQQFDVIYADLSGRLQWNVRLFDNEIYFLGHNVFDRGATALQELGAMASIVYPINPSHRVELGGGYVEREYNFQSTARLAASQFSLEELFVLDPGLQLLGLEDLTPIELSEALDNLFPNGITVPIQDPRQDDYPLVQASLIGDTTSFAGWGPDCRSPLADVGFLRSRSRQ